MMILSNGAGARRLVQLRVVPFSYSDNVIIKDLAPESVKPENYL